jgi:hypothetical protein
MEWDPAKGLWARRRTSNETSVEGVWIFDDSEYGSGMQSSLTRMLGFRPVPVTRHASKLSKGEK